MTCSSSKSFAPWSANPPTLSWEEAWPGRDRTAVQFRMERLKRFSRELASLLKRCEEYNDEAVDQGGLQLFYWTRTVLGADKELRGSRGYWGYVIYTALLGGAVWQLTSSCKGVDHELGASNFSSRNLSFSCANLHVGWILTTAFL